MTDAPDPNRVPGLTSGRVALAFVMLFGALALVRHHWLGSWTYDLGIKAQLLLNCWEGRWLESSIEVNHYFGDHLNPTFLLLTPLVGLTGSAVPLIVAQVLAVAAGGLLVARLARRWLPQYPNLPAIGTAAYLFQCSAGNMVLYDVHEMAFGSVLILWAIDAFDRRKWATAAVATVLAVGCKETGGLVCASLGTWLFISNRLRIAGLAMIALGLAYTYVAIYTIMPHFRGEAADSLQHYAYLQRTPAAALSEVFNRPLHFVLHVCIRIGYVGILLLPALFVQLRFPRTLLPVVWVILPNLLSERYTQYTQWTARWQYDAVIMPFVAVAMLESWRRLADSPTARRWWRESLGKWTLAALLLSTANTTVIGWARYVAPNLGRRAAFDEIAALIPPDAPLSASMNLGPHLLRRQLLDLDVSRSGPDWPADRFRSLPARMADYVIVDELFEPFHFKYKPGAVEQYLANRGYAQVASGDSFALFSRE
jgi:uncharacterized membrane protein